MWPRPSRLVVSASNPASASSSGSSSPPWSTLSRPPTASVVGIVEFSCLLVHVGRWPEEADMLCVPACTRVSSPSAPATACDVLSPVYVTKVFTIMLERVLTTRPVRHPPVLVGPCVRHVFRDSRVLAIRFAPKKKGADTFITHVDLAAFPIGAPSDEHGCSTAM